MMRFTAYDGALLAETHIPVYGEWLRRTFEFKWLLVLYSSLYVLRSRTALNRLTLADTVVLL